MWFKKMVKPRAIDVGWFLEGEKALFIWDAPQRITRNDPPPKHAKSVNYCPAVLEYESRLFEIPCPIDATLKFSFDPDGKPRLANLDGDEANIRGKHLGQMLAVVDRKEWRHPDRPVLQIITPYVFLSDEPVYLTQMPPFIDYPETRLPGVLIGGRLPIDVWPRQMMWAFEWFDISKPLVLKRGKPWFYARFDGYDPTRPIRLFEAEVTTELRGYLKGLSSVSNYVNRTFSLFKIARARRPKTLLVRKKR